MLSNPPCPIQTNHTIIVVTTSNIALQRYLGLDTYDEKHFKWNIIYTQNVFQLLWKPSPTSKKPNSGWGQLYQVKLLYCQNQVLVDLVVEIKIVE